jgi:predicted permease
MENLLLIVICLLAGYLLRKQAAFSGGGAAGLRAFIVYFCLPAVVLKYIPGMQFQTAMLLALASAFLVWMGAWVLFRLWGKWSGADAPTVAVLILMAGLGNTSFVGFPLISLWFGADYIQYALFADQGAFLVMATLGISLASRTATGKIRLQDQLGKLLQFPPFVAFLVALLIQQLRIPLPDFWFPLMTLLAAPLVPLALFSVGLQLDFKERFTEWGLVFKGLIYKLILAPLGIWLLFQKALSQQDPFAQMAVFEAGMAPMITAFILATQYQIKPRVAAMLVGVGIPLSLITTGVWAYLLR